MKRALIITLILCAIAVAYDSPKIAVYVTGNVGEDEKKALGTRMLASLVNSGRYKGIERSNSFLAEIDKEQVRQRSGAIDDNQISALGKQFGVKFICIADITPAFGEFQVSARIVNVETAEVEFIGDASGPLKSMDDLKSVAAEVVKNMFGGQTAQAPESRPEHPRPEAPRPEAPKPEPPKQQPYYTTGNFTDARDGKTYRTMTIGSQTWMAENLNYQTQKSKCYGNNADNCLKYGRLYNWEDAKSACPAGWHLPSDAEWTQLTDFVGGSSIAGKKLKSKSGWDKNGNGTNEFGVLALLPGGYGYGGSFNTLSAATATGGAPRRTVLPALGIGTWTSAASSCAGTTTASGRTCVRFVVCRTESACGSRRPKSQSL